MSRYVSWGPCYALAALLLGCSGAPSGRSASSRLHVPALRTGVSAASGDAPRYDVHEWGLVRAEEGDVLRAGAIGPTVTEPSYVVYKPLLYFHTSSPLTLRSVVVSAAEGGSLVEVWPFAPFDTTVRWTDVALSSSRSCNPSALPTANDAPCRSLAANDFCESSGLAVARTSDAACVTVGSAVELFLFYRAHVTRLTPPLLFERRPGSDEVRVTNESAHEIPGLLVRLRSAGGVVQALASPPPAPSSSVTVGVNFDPAPGASTALYWNPPDACASGRTALHESLLELGLTLPEAAAFVMAWEQALFRPTSIDTTTTTLPVDSFVYFLPEPLVDGIARLEFDPPPRTIHRAMAMWSVLRASGPSH